MILETLLSSSAVARGFSGYLATLVGRQPVDFLVSPLELDFFAAGLILCLTAVLSRGTKQSSVFNIVVCSINLSCIAFILIAGLPQAESTNLQPFFPYGTRGTFAAASIVFFAFVGFDYIANAAEEASDPRRGLPVGIIASLGIATLLYVLMATTLVMMVPAAQVDIHAPFSDAFAARGVHWAAKIVSCGALAGIITSTMTGLLSQARLFVVLGRERLLPAALARVHPTTNCPLVATLVTGGCAATLALLLDINILAELVSVGTLYVFYAVCAGTYYWRCHIPGSNTRPQAALIRIGALTLSSLCLSISFTYRAPTIMLILFSLAWICAAVMMCTLKAHRIPSRFAIPFFPLTSILGILFTIHLLCSLGWPAYVRFVVWMVLGGVVYAVYGAKAAEAHEMEIKLVEQQQQERGGAGGDVELSSLDPEGAVGLEEDQRWLLRGADGSGGDSVA